MPKFDLLEKKLGVKFKNKDLLIQAFCHRSYLNENPDFYLAHNERLEFLGDAVLELVVTEYLYKKYPDKPEGEMTNWRAALVNAKILGDLAGRLNFNDFLLLSKGEEKESGKSRLYILANTFESFVGALYLDSGYRKSKDFIENNLVGELSQIIKEGSYKDAKSLFQEKAQERDGVTPTYKVLKELGPDHAKIFTIGVYLGLQLVAKGEGLSKQEAEEQAAKQALEVYKK